MGNRNKVEFELGDDPQHIRVTSTVENEIVRIDSVEDESRLAKELEKSPVMSGSRIASHQWGDGFDEADPLAVGISEHFIETPGSYVWRIGGTAGAKFTVEASCESTVELVGKPRND